MGTATNAQIESALVAKCGADVGRGFRTFAEHLPDETSIGVPIVPLRPLMLELRALGVNVAMLTSDTRRSTEVFLNHYGLNDLVSISVCGDDGLEPKPSAEPLLAICTRLGVSPE